MQSAHTDISYSDITAMSSSQFDNVVIIWLLLLLDPEIDYIDIEIATRPTAIAHFLTLFLFQNQIRPFWSRNIKYSHFLPTLVILQWIRFFAKFTFELMQSIVSDEPFFLGHRLLLNPLPQTSQMHILYLSLAFADIHK